MNLDVASILMLGVGSATGFYVLMMTAPFRRFVLSLSWFIDLLVTWLLIMIFHASTAGMGIAMIGGLTFSIQRYITCKIMKVRDIFQIIGDAFKPKKLSHNKR